MAQPELLAAIDMYHMQAERHQNQMEMAIRSFGSAWSIAVDAINETFRAQQAYEEAERQMVNGIWSIALGACFAGALNWMGDLVLGANTLHCATMEAMARPLVMVPVLRNGQLRRQLSPTHVRFTRHLQAPSHAQALRRAENLILSDPMRADRHLSTARMIGALKESLETAITGTLPFVVRVAERDLTRPASLFNGLVVQNWLLNRLAFDWEQIATIFQGVYEAFSLDRLTGSLDRLRQALQVWTRQWNSLTADMRPIPDMAVAIERFLWAQYIKRMPREAQYRGRWVADLSEGPIVERLRRLHILREAGVEQLRHGTHAYENPPELIDWPTPILGWAQRITAWAEGVPAPALCRTPSRSSATNNSIMTIGAISVRQVRSP